MKVYRLCPELGDGASCSIVDSIESVNAAIETALREGEPGECFTVEILELSQAELDALPEL